MPLTDLLLLSLLILINGAPILVRQWLGSRLSAPLDAGRKLADGRPLFGASKTWRGLAAALLCGGLAAPLLGLPWSLGLAMAAAAMAGDLLSSFTKRRLGIEPSGQALGLDQIPESLLPLLVARHWLPALGLGEALLLSLLFLVVELGLSRLLYRLRIRKRPY
ncbi:CDP-archaeol synthase [Thiohalobacter sp. IOR34]|uniref:CDP-archaeol synthase n=1 Tax=Thiohalobacter sp. IOR34 TaxID=3057176 RepID=UPI0025B065DD|nr:CDP-archaeol synthase [Thiohalobacter sp. IOR34]WJW74633.1 CDP-archaeol synthase [Thiohalobacter sp. IOR34]